MADSESGSRVFSNEQARGLATMGAAWWILCPKRRRVEPISVYAIGATIPRWCCLGDGLKLACVIGQWSRCTGTLL